MVLLEAHTPVSPDRYQLIDSGPSDTMNLLDYFFADLAALSTKERRRRRVHWHRAAVRYLNMLALTADPIPPFHRENDITTVPYDAFFLRFPRSELEQLYRVTKGRG